MRKSSVIVVLACGVVAAAVGASERTDRSTANGLELAIACQRGNTHACDDAQPYAARYGDYELFELDASCVLGHDAFACEEVANALHTDDDASPEMRPLAASRMARALELFVAGCRAGGAEHCAGASRAYDAGFGVMWNELASRTYGNAACQHGVITACEREGDRDLGAEAIAMYRRACPASPHACMKLARVEEATGLAIATTDYRIACDHLVVDACAHLASREAAR